MQMPAFRALLTYTYKQTICLKDPKYHWSYWLGKASLNIFRECLQQANFGVDFVRNDIIVQKWCHYDEGDGLNHKDCVAL